MSFSAAELAYLGTQWIGRLATVDPTGAPQNSPVGFRVDSATGVIDIHGHHLGETRKFRNVARDGRVSFVVDDIVSVTPWRVRGVEIRGRAQALEDQPRPGAYLSGEVIRIHPDRIISWGLDQGLDSRHADGDPSSL